jgi:hypothetical protein
MFSVTGGGSAVAEEQLPVDIQYSQLLGWLVRRPRACCELPPQRTMGERCRCQQHRGVSQRVSGRGVSRKVYPRTGPQPWLPAIRQISMSSPGLLSLDAEEQAMAWSPTPCHTSHCALLPKTWRESGPQTLTLRAPVRGSQVDRKKIPADWRKRLVLVQKRMVVAAKTLPANLTTKVRLPPVVCPHTLAGGLCERGHTRAPSITRGLMSFVAGSRTFPRALVPLRVLVDAACREQPHCARQPLTTLSLSPRSPSHPAWGLGAGGAAPRGYCFPAGGGGRSGRCGGGAQPARPGERPSATGE